MNASKPHRNVIMTLVLAGLGAAYLYFVYLPSQREIRRVEKDLALRRQYIRQSLQAATALPAIEAKLQTVRQQTARWTAAAPTPEQVGTVYARINALVDQTGAATTRFQPLADLPQGTIHRFPVNLAISGSFPQACQFLYDLEQLPATLWIEDLKIEQAAGAGQDVSCELTVVIVADNSENSDQANRSG